MAARTALVRFRLELALTRIVSACVRVLPMSVVRTCGGALGRAVYVVDGFHRRIAMTNLASAFPTRSASERRAIARAMFAHFGRLLLELMKFGMLSDEQMLARTRELMANAGSPEERNIYQQAEGAAVRHLEWLRGAERGEPVRLGYFGRTRPVSMVAGYRQSTSSRAGRNSRRARQGRSR